MKWHSAAPSAQEMVQYGVHGRSSSSKESVLRSQQITTRLRQIAFLSKFN
jgi:hypothetical protein